MIYIVLDQVRYEESAVFLVTRDPQSIIQEVSSSFNDFHDTDVLRFEVWEYGKRVAEAEITISHLETDGNRKKEQLPSIIEEIKKFLQSL
jgi:hypothetical protein